MRSSSVFLGLEKLPATWPLLSKYLEKRDQAERTAIVRHSIYSCIFDESGRKDIQGLAVPFWKFQKSRETYGPVLVDLEKRKRQTSSISLCAFRAQEKTIVD